MKKLDKLLITSFLGPFFITFLVVVFILLLVFMLKYFDEIVGKGLGFGVISQLLFYFSINMTTNALPLAVLLSSLMTFGNLGVHFELTAIKSSGVSLLRVMQPLFLISCLLVVLGFINNNYLVPKANLEAYSLLYDIKQKKPALDIKQGVFYNSIPGYSIKINERFPDGETLRDIIIYDHIGQRGNKAVILADSGKMYNIMDNSYLVFELFKGQSYSEQPPPRNRRFKANETAKPYLRSEFEKSKMVLDLSEFELKRTRKELFNNNREMKTIDQLTADLDSMVREYNRAIVERRMNTHLFYEFHQQDIIDVRSKYDSLQKIDTTREMGIEHRLLPNGDTIFIDAQDNIAKNDSNSVNSDGALSVQGGGNREENKSHAMKMIDSVRSVRLKTLRKNEEGNVSNVFNRRGSDITRGELQNNNKDIARQSTPKEHLIVDTRTAREKLDSMLSLPFITRSSTGKALNHVQYIKGNMGTHKSQTNDMIKRIRRFEIERYKKLAMALTILAMFLIGAPLGAIIKKGGLGMPVIISVFFFVLFYVISMLGEKWARQGLMEPLMGVWLANIVLFPIGFFFLIQARRDARLFDGDYYRIAFIRIREKYFAKKMELAAKN